MNLFESRRTVFEGITVLVTDSEEVQQWNEMSLSMMGRFG